MTGKVRDLPPLPVFARELTDEFGGVAHVLIAGDYPATAVAFEGQHALLLRNYSHAITISLPNDKSWSLQTKEEWAAEKADVKKALAAFRDGNKRGCSMADVIFALLPAIERLDGVTDPWDVDFPGTPVPSESWIKRDDHAIGLFQQGAAVQVTVWVGSDMRVTIVTSPNEVAPLVPWLREQLKDQDAAAKAAAASAAKQDEDRKARGLPTLAHVIERMKAGKRFQAGGGRCHSVYWWENGRIQGYEFDEGHTFDFTPTDDQMRTAIENHPDVFNEVDFRRD